MSIQWLVSNMMLDMSELVKNVKGPSEWFCKNGKDCWYNGNLFF
jgi:hypothetical protein